MIRPVKELSSTTDLNAEEQLVIVEVIEEYLRRGDFEMIFPRRETVDRYKKYFKVSRSCNYLVWKWLKLNPTERIAILKDFKLKKHATEDVLNEIKLI